MKYIYMKINLYKYKVGDMVEYVLKGKKAIGKILKINLEDKYTISFNNLDIFSFNNLDIFYSDISESQIIKLISSVGQEKWIPKEKVKNEWDGWIVKDF
jgi:hypothetical protein